MDSTRFYDIFVTPDKGRGLKALYEILPGVEILKEKPLVFTLTNCKSRGSYCDYCFSSPANLFKCGKCKYTEYCGKDCQLSDWFIHRQECKYLVKVLPRQPPDICRIISHILFKYYIPSKKRILNDKADIENLTSNSSLITNARKEAFFAFAAVLNEYLQDCPIDMKSVDIYGLLCRVSCNSFTITNGELNSVGTGMYKVASLLNHSCSPNCIALFNGTEIQIRSIKHISKGEEITIAYVSLLDLQINRQNELSEGYMFTCKCEACVNASFGDFLMRSMKCEDCPIPCIQSFSRDVSINDDEKAQYQKVFGAGTNIQRCEFDENTATRASSLSDELQAFYQEIKIVPSLQQFHELKSLIMRGERVLGPTNISLVHCYEVAMDGCLDQLDWKMAFQYALKLEKAYLMLLPENHPSIGLHYFKQGKLAFLVDELRIGIRSMQQAKKYLTITHGSDHEYISMLEKSLSEASRELKMKHDNSIIDRIYDEMNEE